MASQSKTKKTRSNTKTRSAQTISAKASRTLGNLSSLVPDADELPKAFSRGYKSLDAMSGVGMLCTGVGIGVGIGAALGLAMAPGATTEARGKITALYNKAQERVAAIGHDVGAAVSNVFDGEKPEALEANTSDEGASDRRTNGNHGKSRRERSAQA